MKINEEYEVKITGTDENGNGIARINNFVIFIKGALKDELLRIKIININKHYATGTIIEVIKNNSNRINFKCSNYLLCGGCDFLHLPYDEEIKIKQEKINKIFPNYKVNDLIYANSFHYRNKVVLHIKNKKIGFYEKNTNKIIEIKNCLLIDKKINEVIDQIKEIDFSLLEQVMIRKSYFTNEILLDFMGKIEKIELEKLLKNINIKSIYLNEKLVFGNSYIVEIINGIKYSIYPKSFFQVNTLQMIKLYEQIKKYAGFGENLLDLYCGTGTIGIFLKDNFQKILGVEKIIDSIDNANINKKLNNINNIEFKCINADYLKKEKYDVIVVDPPRSGLSNKVIDTLLAISSKKIIYVSCNPNTLKNDLKMLEEQYEIKEITPVDMFPRTLHAECVTLLNLKSHEK